jgi:hypothetical protein
VPRKLAWRPLLREASSYLVVGLTVGTLVLGVWWTRHPDSTSLSAVRGWPLVGPLAGRLQDRYLPAPASAVEAGVPLGSGSPAVTSAASQGTPPGAPRGESSGAGPLVDFELAYELREPRPYVWVDEGVALYRGPSFDSPPLYRMEATTNLFVEERRGDWARVRHRGTEAWVIKPRAGTAERHGNRPAPVLPIRGRGPEPAVVGRALAAMSAEAQEFTLGPYSGHTDAAVDPLVARCLPVVADLEARYVEAIGLRPQGLTEERLFVFADQAGYDAFHSGEVRSRTGHAGSGYAAVLLGGRGVDGVCTTLVHEAVHLLNRRAIGPALPSWLDEGIAGYQRWASFGARPPKGVSEQARGAGALPSLAALVGLGAEDFHSESGQTLHYEVSALWIEYLLGDPGLADGFRSFLAYLAAGGPWGLDPSLESRGPARESAPLGDDLLHFLGRSYGELDAAFRAWLWSRP